MRAARVAVASIALALPTLARGGELSAGSTAVSNALAADRDVHLGYRWAVAAPVNLEVRVGYVPAFGERTSDLARTLVLIAETGTGDVDFQQPVRADVVRAAVLVDLAPQRRPQELEVVPRLRAGLAVVDQVELTARYGDSDVEVTRDGTRLAAPVLLELAGELWSPRGFALRATMGVATDRAPAPQYDPKRPVEGKTWVSSPSTSLDLVFDLGARR